MSVEALLRALHAVRDLDAVALGAKVSCAQEIERRCPELTEADLTARIRGAGERLRVRLQARETVANRLAWVLQLVVDGGVAPAPKQQELGERAKGGTAKSEPKSGTNEISTDFAPREHALRERLAQKWERRRRAERDYPPSVRRELAGRVRDLTDHMKPPSFLEPKS